MATDKLRLGGRRDHWTEIQMAWASDILLLQESPNPRSLWSEAETDSSQYSTCWQPVSGYDWGSAVVVRNATIRSIELPTWAGWVAVGEVQGLGWPWLSGEPLLTVSLHARTLPKHEGRTNYVRQVSLVLDDLAPISAGRPLILGGDFNFLSLGLRLPEESRRTTDEEREVLERLKNQFGLVNCWQSANPDQPLPQTLRWRNDPSEPYHCDGLFVPPHGVKDSEPAMSSSPRGG